jgi:hypothetical protein
VIDNIPPGRYSFVTRAAPGFYVKSIKVDDREMDQLIDVGPQALLKVDVLLAAGGGTLTGTVEDPDGKPATGAVVSIHTIDGSPLRTDLEKTAGLKANGEYSISGIAPGIYRVFAWDSQGNGEWRYDAFRKEYESRSVTIKIGDNGKETVALKAIPLPK